MSVLGAAEVDEMARRGCFFLANGLGGAGGAGFSTEILRLNNSLAASLFCVCPGLVVELHSSRETTRAGIVSSASDNMRQLHALSWSPVMIFSWPSCGAWRRMGQTRL